MHNRRRDSYIETSYTGVGAFSSAPAPHTNALAAASAIGNALKANNQNPTNLNIPSLQAPKSVKPLSRSTSITSSSQKRNSIVPSTSITQTYINQSRNNSINTANARRLSLSSIPKQRLLSQKSTPNLKSRRSVSDLTNSHSSTVIHLPPRNIPRTIKKYVPSANGLVAVEVPNPEHPDNMKPSNPPPRNSLYRRSISMANVSVRSQQQQHSLQQSQEQRKVNSISNYKSSPSKLHSHSMTDRNTSRSISKNIRRQTKILPDGTKVISTTVEEHIQVPPNGIDNSTEGDTFDDAYDDFDDDHREVDMTLTLDDMHSDIIEEEEEENVEEKSGDGGIAILQKSVLQSDSANSVKHKQKNHNIPESEKNTDDFVGELASEIKEEADIKKMIEHNEKMERFEREKAFKSVDETVQDPVIIEDIMTRKFTNGLHSDLSASSNSAVHLSGITTAGLGLLASNKPISSTISYDNIDESYNDFYEEEYQRPTNEGKDVRKIEPEKSSDNFTGDIDEADYVDDIDEADYVDDIDEADYVDDIDEDVQPKSNTQQEYSEEEYIAAQRKLDKLVKQKEQEIINEMIKNGEVTKEDIGITQTDNIDNDTNISVCSDETDLKNGIQSIEQTVTKNTPSQQLNKLSNQNLNSSKRSSSVYSLVDENIQGTERFYTPPITPVTDVVDPIKKVVEGVVENTNVESAVNTVESSVFVTPKAESNFFSAETSFSNTKTSESSESSMVHDSRTSVVTTPIKNSQPKQSMAQQLRATVTASRSYTACVPDTENLNHYANDKVFSISEKVHVDGKHNTDPLANLKVPKREPSIQAKIDNQEKLKNASAETIEDIEDINRAPDNHQLNSSNTSLSGSVNNKRRSVLKNSSANRLSLHPSNNQANASDAYLTLATAQNTKMNSISPLNQNLGSGPGPVSSRRLNVNTLQDPNINQRSTRSRSGSAASANIGGSICPNNGCDITPLAAAAKAAQKHSTQSRTLSTSRNNRTDSTIKRNSNLFVRDNHPVNISLETAMENKGTIKAANPNVERAKKRILQNRPVKNRAKELYELAKTRAPIKPDDLIALDDSMARKSSFEKVEPHHSNSQNESGPNGASVKGKMSELSLRDHTSVNYEEYERKNRAQSNFKSRFADNESDTDIPLPPLSSVNGKTDRHLFSASENQSVDNSLVPDKTRSGFKFKLGNKKKSKPHAAVINPNLQSSNFEIHQQSENNTQYRESKFEKFFSEPHGPPSHRNVSNASAITTESTVPDGGKKKKGFFKKMFN